MEAAAPKKLGFSGTVASVTLDAIRGFAALQVFSRHWRNMFLVDYSQASVHKSVLALPYLLTALGHQAVLIFFVLSGFLIGGSVIRAVDGNHFHWGRYMTRRLSRLWVVLIPALALTALCDRVGILSGRAAQLYGGADFNHMTRDVASTTSWKIFFGNMFFLNGLHGIPTFGSDGALWTLAFEFWYYVVFILAWLAISNKTKTRMRVIYGVLAVAISVAVGSGMMSMFPIWLMGTALVWCKPPKVGSAVRWAVTVPYVLLILYMSKAPHLQGLYVGDYPVGLATMLWLWVQLSAVQPANPKSPVVRTARWFSRLAFTMYAVHEPMLVLAAAFLLGDTRMQPTGRHLAGAILVWILVFGYIFLIARLTEFQTDRVRQKIDRWLGFDKHPKPSPHELALEGKVSTMAQV